MDVGDLRRKRVTGSITCVPTRAARLRCLIAGLLLCLVSASRAEQLPFKNYTTADGLARDHCRNAVSITRVSGWIKHSTSQALWTHLPTQVVPTSSPSFNIDRQTSS